MADAGVRYRDKVTIVTGGSTGIGKGCVQVFVKHGSKVVFCARGEEAGRALESEVNATGPGQATFIQCDVSKEDQIKNVIDKTVEKYGRIDCLINNAGQLQHQGRIQAGFIERAYSDPGACPVIGDPIVSSHGPESAYTGCFFPNGRAVVCDDPPKKTIDEFTADDFRRLLDINLVSYFLFCKFALPHLRKTEGSIINDTSLVAQIGQPGAVTYVATKGGITSFTKALAIDEAKYNVRVNSFSPGNVWTPMWEKETQEYKDPAAARKSGEDCQLVGRFGTIEESGLLCLFLAADATFCTGIDINLSGGAELSYGVKNMRLSE